MEAERCVDCDALTGKAGQGDGSLYTESGRGPYCCDCYNSARVEELTAEVERLHQHDCASAIRQARCRITALKKVNAELETEIDALRARVAVLEKVLRHIVQWSDACWSGGYAGDPKTPHPAWEDVQEGRKLLK